MASPEVDMSFVSWIPRGFHLGVGGRNSFEGYARGNFSAIEETRPNGGNSEAVAEVFCRYFEMVGYESAEDQFESARLDSRENERSAVDNERIHSTVGAKEASSNSIPRSSIG